MKKKQRWGNNYSVIAESFTDFLSASNEKEILASVIIPLVKRRNLIVDVGAGMGEITSKLASHSQKIIAIEPHKGYIPYLYKSLSNGNYEVISKNIEDIRLPPSSVDAVLFSHSLPYMDDFREGIQRTLNWLKPGGIGIFVVLSKKGDQTDLMRRFWDYSHPNDPLSYPYADEVEQELTRLGQKTQRRKVKSTIVVPSDKKLAQLVAFILEISPERFENNLDSKLKRFLARKKQNGRYQIATEHEIVFFNKSKRTL